jgi:hypothetical protein
MQDRKVLHSWKDISNYTGRGIRTLQRYEVDSGFPVHRPAGKSRSAVLAFSDELDAWLNKPQQPRQNETPALRVGIERARRYHEIAAKAKHTEGMARAAFERCMDQAIRVREMILKIKGRQLVRARSV